MRALGAGVDARVIRIVWLELPLIVGFAAFLALATPLSAVALALI